MRFLTIPLALSMAFGIAVGCDLGEEPTDDLSYRKLSAAAEQKAPCEDDTDCNDGTVCEPSGPLCNVNKSSCVPGCHEDADCGSGEFCEQVDCVTCPCPGSCQPEGGDGCEDDDDCGQGTVCEPGGPSCDLDDMQCVAGCHEDADCGSGEICDPVVCVTCPCPGNCIPDDTSCESDYDCGPGTVCEPSFPGCGTDQMECVAGCHDDNDCGYGQACQPQYCFTCPCPGVCG
ncbi:MAG: hypothetical protein AAF799_19820 [Myxococcota bacterium]